MYVWDRKRDEKHPFSPMTPAARKEAQASEFNRLLLHPTGERYIWRKGVPKKVRRSSEGRGAARAARRAPRKVLRSSKRREKPLVVYRRYVLKKDVQEAIRWKRIEAAAGKVHVDDVLAPLGWLSKRAWTRLLNLEKDRRGAPRKHLVFIGIANVADYWWCAARAVMESREGELAFFRAYLEDRLRYSMELGCLARLPKRQKDWLEIGEELTLRDLQPLLNRRQERARHAFVEIPSMERDGVVYINPALLPDQREEVLNMARERGLQIGEDPVLEGKMMHTTHCGRGHFASLRWNFPWQHYVVVGVPDGLTDDFVCEYKTTGRAFLLWYIKPVAFAQTDIYGYFFRRTRKRVHVLVRESSQVKEFDELVDSKNAVRTLRSFGRADGGAPPKSPVAWKCKRCDWAKRCPLKTGRPWK